jgi:hypothetical protein
VLSNTSQQRAVEAVYGNLHPTYYTCIILLPCTNEIYLTNTSCMLQ